MCLYALAKLELYLDQRCTFICRSHQQKWQPLYQPFLWRYHSFHRWCWRIHVFWFKPVLVCISHTFRSMISTHTNTINFGVNAQHDIPMDINSIYITTSNLILSENISENYRLLHKQNCFQLYLCGNKHIRTKTFHLLRKISKYFFSQTASQLPFSFRFLHMKNTK